MLRTLLASLLLLALPLVGHAQSVMNLAPGTSSNNIPYNSSPEYLSSVDGTLFFSAHEDAANGDFTRVVWASDGTLSGTRLVQPGVTFSSSFGGFVDLNGTAFYIADDGTNGNELWKSDGTEAGTQMVKDIWPGSSSSFVGGRDVSDVTVYKNQVFFPADDGTNGLELWKSDGTAAGTQMVKDINTSGDADVGNLIVAGNTLYFVATDGSSGFELWKSDGTEGGTSMVNLNPGQYGASIDEMAAAGGTLYLSCICGGGVGTEIWTSDGTASGTVLLKDIETGTASSNPDELRAMNGNLFFAVNGEDLWTSNGTSAGTQVVKDFSTTSASNPLEHLTVVGSTLYFARNVYETSAALWTSDGTTAGTTRLWFSSDTDRANEIDRIGHAGPMAFFTAYDSNRGTELWRSGGTAGTTGFLKDLDPRALSFSEGSSYPENFASAGGAFFFTADSPDYGNELWTTGPTQTYALPAGDSPEQSFSTLSLSVDFAQASSSAMLTAFRDVNASASGLNLPGAQQLAAKGMWRIDLGDAGSVEAEVCLGLDDLTVPRSSPDFSQLRVYKRPAASGTWSQVGDSDVRLRSDGTDPDPDDICATVTSFSEFIVTGESSVLPVELAQFDARLSDDDAVALRWKTAAETNNAGFRVQRRVGAVGPASEAKGASVDQAEAGWQTVGRRTGAGTTTEPQSYRFTDDALPYAADQLIYRLKQIDADGTTSVSDPVTVERRTVKQVQLLGTAPNPARSQATVRFSIPASADAETATLRLYDVLGRAVRTLATDAAVGRHTLSLDTSGLPSGVYVLRLEVGEVVKTQRLTVVQ